MKRVLLSFLISVTSAVSLADEQHVPHIDRLFLHVQDGREEMISAIVQNLKKFCEGVDRLNDEERTKSMAAVESCQLLRVVKGLEESEHELGIKNGEPFLSRVYVRNFDEACAWRYFIRIQKVRRLMKSLRTYFSQTGGLAAARVGLIGIPKLAGSLDRYSYWTRLISMQDNSTCPDKGSSYCESLQAQLPSLAAAAFSASSASVAATVINERNLYLLELSKRLRLRLTDMSLDELNQLEKMQDATSAGLGIPYFRQLLNRLNIVNENVDKAESAKIQSAMMVLEIQEAIARWKQPKASVNVDPDAVRALSTELNTILQPLRGNL